MKNKKSKRLKQISLVILGIVVLLLASITASQVVLTNDGLMSSIITSLTHLN